MDAVLLENSHKVLEALFQQLPGALVHWNERVKQSLVETRSSSSLTVTFQGIETHFQVVAKLKLYKSNVSQALQAAKRLAGREANVIVYADYLASDAGADLRVEGVSFCDAVGNCYIKGANFLLDVSGKHKSMTGVLRARRELSLSARKAGVLVRHMLTGERGQAYGVRELAKATGASPGYVSTALRALTARGYFERSPSGTYVLADPSSLLDNWVSASPPGWARRLLLRVFSPTPGEVIAALSSAAAKLQVRHAMTLWSAANAIKLFTTEERVAFYMNSPLDVLQASGLKYEAAERFENVWLLYPRDEGVYERSAVIKDTMCVHPVQLYHDLMHAPYRAKSVAEMLRGDILGF